MLSKSSAVTATQKGSVGESIVKIELILESAGRLSPFEPFADDDGIDLLVYDKTTGNAVPIQIKTRVQAKKRNPTVQFQVRRATFDPGVCGFVLAVLLEPDGRNVERAWLFTMAEFSEVASSVNSGKAFAVRPNMKSTSRDKYTLYRCKDMAEATRRLCEYFDQTVSLG